ncbi:uncharacterized protein EV420DRAFT_1509627 [Desarmillaria tabescens]|uniref:Uncharacterized protein n=1 Tax=Armillaria tabescens TaxID=1929756 RepID=A0AA39NI56_ARMTA|nr:uncharacterized protein EV420DRAFT_1509627 [Desarmillaria tabescens]KAK0466070.1 hypothetical protein EV420DRAFT_1509627 [Desarmillaria tabescens]
MPSSVVVIPRPAPATHETHESPNASSHGEIYRVYESLLHPFHQLCMAALDNTSIKTSPACRRIIESICSSSNLSTKPGIGGRGKERPAILCPAPAGLPHRANEPWLFLMGTFGGQDATTLPQIYKDFSITVRTGPPNKDGTFCIRTIPEWRTSSPGKTQHVVVIPVTPESGVPPEDHWVAFGTRNGTYRVVSADLARLVSLSTVKLGDFFEKLSSNPKYLVKVANELDRHERQYRAQKKLKYAASRKSFNMQQLERGMQSMQLADSTNTGFDRAPMNRSSPSKKPAPSVYSKASARVVL